MQTNKDPVLEGILRELRRRNPLLCPQCQQTLEKLLEWHSYDGLSKAQLLQAEVDRILRDESPEDERRQTLEKLRSFHDPDSLKYYYIYESRAAGHLFHYAYLRHRYELLQLK